LGSNVSEQKGPILESRTAWARLRVMVSLVSTASQEFIGPYRLLNIIKTGQTSQVWAVLSSRDQQRLALKILLAEYRRDREHLGFLKQEYVVGKTLDHPRVIRVYEFAFDRRIPYLVMEYFPAPNMKDIIFQVREMLGYLMPKMIAQAAEGLAYFNAQGWVHRDVKPDNFLVSQEGEVKLIDFALAVRPKKGLARLFSPRTKIQGTRSYMSPEQIRGGALDARSDVYSFGCTIFHLVSGRPPFTGTSSNELLKKHLTAQVPRIEAYERNVTTEFGDLIQRTMAKKPESRPKSIDEFLTTFRAITMFKQPPRPPAHADQTKNAT
jgi:eukaryotic-like serine/threonine-protein kinase